MGRRPGSAFAAALASFIAGTAPLSAHPHVWLDAVATFVFEGEQLRALRLTWAFDEFFGTAIIRRFDENRNGSFEPAENAELEKGAFANLKEYGWFTHLKIDGKHVPVGGVSGFQASTRNGQLVYDFTLALPPNLDPTANEVAVSLFDESYFVEVSLEATDPVRFQNMAPGRCAFAVRDGDGTTATGFAVAPFQTITLSCKK
jgi:ABC-type uncharacterized transport system substrate-binding protein